MASSRFLRSQFRVSGFVSDGRVNGAWVVEWKVVETGPKSPKKRLFIAIFWSIPTLAFLTDWFLSFTGFFVPPRMQAMSNQLTASI